MSRANISATKIARSSHIKGHPRVVKVIKHPSTYKKHYLVQRQEINKLKEQSEEWKQEVLFAQSCAITDLLESVRCDYQNQFRDLFYAPVVQIYGEVNLPTYMCRRIHHTDLMKSVLESEEFQKELEHARNYATCELVLELLKINKRRQTLYYTVYPSEVEISDPDSDDDIFKPYRIEE